MATGVEETETTSERDRAMGARRPVRPWMAVVAVILGAATATACGDSSNDAKTNAATKTSAATTDAATATAATTAATAQPSAVPAVSPEVKAWNDAGTVRLAALWVGTPGRIVVEPKGNVEHWDHYYPRGTKVTVTAKDGKVGRFAEWSGACSGKRRVCKVTMTGRKRLVGGFLFDKAAAKRLSPDDPALKPGTGA